jgi:hypothetical protein
MDGSYAGLTGNTKLKRAIFPNLRTIKGRTDGVAYARYQLNNCTNEELEIVFPKLQTIESSCRFDAGAFTGVSNVVIPESVKTIGDYNFGGNLNVTLNCRAATDIHPNWCYSSPTVSFSMCKEWQASINIAKAAANLWNAERMRDFMENYLANLNDYAPEYSGGGGVVIGAELTIPQAILTTLEENGEDGEVVEENGETRKGCLLIAEEKGWIIGGA